MTPITIEKFDGISDSPYTGFDVIANCDIDEDGAIKPNLKYHVTNLDALSGVTFTADETTDIITHADLTDATTGLYGNDVRAVTFSNVGGALPTGLSAGTTYWLVRQTNTTSKIASTWQNAVATPPVTVNFTTNGTGTHSMTSINMGTVRQIDKDKNSSRYFAIDTAGKLWVNNSNSWGWEYILTINTGGVGVGLVVFKNYVLLFGQRYVDGVGPISGDRSTWTRTSDFIDTGSATSTTNKDVILGQGIGSIGDSVFYTNYDRIGQIYENTGQTFSPSSGATYTTTTNVFTPKYRPVCLAEYGDNLAIGTQGGLYIWDKDSDTAELPTLSGKYVSSLAVGGNTLYALSGETSTETLGLYATNGTTAQLLVEIPNRIATAGYGKARGMNVIKDKVFFLISGTYTVYNSNVYNGLWSYNTKNGKLVLENIATSGAYDTLQGTIFGVNSQTSRPLYLAAGTQIGSITYQNTYYQLYDNFEPYFITPLYVIGTDHKPATIMTADFIFDRPLANADEVRISYRTSTQGNFTTVGSVGYTSNGAKRAVEFPMGGIETDIIQFKVELNAENTGVNMTSGPTIRTIIIR